MSSKYIPGAVLSGAADLIEELGGDAVALARQSGVPINSLKDSDIPVDIATVLKFFDSAAIECQCPNFGIRLASRNGFDIFGPLWILLRNAQSLRQMLEDLNNNYGIYTQAATTSLEKTEHGLCLCWDTASNLVLNTQQGAEYGFALCVNDVRRFIPDFLPYAVEFRHAPPVDISIHKRLFGAKLYFDQPRNAIHFPNAVLDAPLDSANSLAHRLVQSILQEDSKAALAALPDKIEGIIRALLPYSPCTVEEVSLSVGMSVRMLQIKLKNQGTSFKKIKDRVRYDLALKFLHSSTLSMTEISEILGYSELSAFSRSFRRWHGSSLTCVAREIASRDQTMPE